MAKDLGLYFCGLLFASVFIAAFPAVQITLGAVYLFECPAAPGVPVYVMVCGISALLVIGLLAFPKILCPAAQRNTLWTVCFICLLLFVFIWFLYGSFQIYSVFPPSYEKNITDPHKGNDSFSASPALDNMLGLPLENQSLPNLNRTPTTINSLPARKLIQTRSLGNVTDETKQPKAQRVMASAAYCNKAVYLFAFWTTTLVYILVAHGLAISFCIFGFMKMTDLFTKYLST